MYCLRCGEPNLSGTPCPSCLTDKEYREIYGIDDNGLWVAEGKPKIFSQKDHDELRRIM